MSPPAVLERGSGQRLPIDEKLCLKVLHDVIPSVIKHEVWRCKTDAEICGVGWASEEFS